jgi:hypothetical protein
MPCCSQSICQPTTQTPEERCEELQPHFSWEVQCDKIHVEWDGIGNPDCIRYELYKWVDDVNAPNGKRFDVISTITGSRYGIFHCVPEGEFSIRISASVGRLVPISNGSCGSCGGVTYHYEELCVRQWDACNCLIPCPEDAVCIGGDCIGAITDSYICAKDCGQEEYGITPSPTPDYPFPIYDYEPFVQGDSESRKFWDAFDTFNNFANRCQSIVTQHTYVNLNKCCIS